MEERTAKELAYEEVYQAYYADIYRACLHLTKDKEKACQYLQETFVKFYEQFEGVEECCRFAYLVRIARDLVHNEQQ